MTQDGYNAYLDTASTVSEIDQLIMLYDGAIRSVKDALQALEDSDYEAVYNNSVKACAIVFGLKEVLVYEDNTKETAEALAKSYEDISFQIISLQTEHKVENGQLAIDNLTILKNAWLDVKAATEEVTQAPAKPIEEGTPADISIDA